MENITLHYLNEDKSQRLDVWLAAELEKTRSCVQNLISSGAVTVNGKPVKAGTVLKYGDEIYVIMPEPTPLDMVSQEILLDIVYEDDDIIVINKPKNMVVHPAAGNPDGTLVNALLHHCDGGLSDINGVIRPGIVHRIDKDTTGLICVAKNNAAHLSLAEQLKNHTMERIYIALVDGIINEDSAIINAPIGRHPIDRKKMAVNTKNGREAITHFKVLERFPHSAHSSKAYTLIEARLETGRTHQIRVHMAYIGHPVCGDEVYGKKFPLCETNGQMLHAYKLSLIHPRTKIKETFTAPIPTEFESILDIIQSPVS